MTNSGNAQDVELVSDGVASLPLLGSSTVTPPSGIQGVPTGNRIVRFNHSGGWEQALERLAIEESICSRAACFIPYRPSFVSRTIAEHRLFVRRSDAGSILHQLAL